MRRRCVILLATWLCACAGEAEEKAAPPGPPPPPPERYDVLVRGGTLYDGSGDPGEVLDLAIRGDRVV